MPTQSVTFDTARIEIPSNGVKTRASREIFGLFCMVILRWTQYVESQKQNLLALYFRCQTIQQ
jgi:hypothetical protein